MVKRLIAICFIFAGTTAAWMILGSTVYYRTNDSNDQLRGRVQSVWGVPQMQMAPTAEYESHVLRPETSQITTNLQLDQRRKGLLWYSTYKVDFAGDYEFTNPEVSVQHMRLVLQFPAAQALYDDLQFSVDGRAVRPVVKKDHAFAERDIEPGQTVKLHLGYRSQGLESWRYSFGADISAVSNFHLRMSTNFKDIDFPDSTLAPSEKKETADGWQLDWNYKNLLSGYEIAMAMPQKTQPGPLAAQISFFAPVSLFFFFFLIYMITTIRGMDLHPMHYFFLACAFFAFHLLLAYMVDHVDIYASFGISAVVSIFLVVSYLRIVTGPRFAIREAAITQFVYLVLFSFAFFFRGFTGLTITIGSVLTLFVVMQMTARIKWDDKFAPAPPRIPAPVR